MSKEFEIDKVAEILSDDHVFQFDNGNTLTVGKLKELFRSQFGGKFLGYYKQQGLSYPEIKSDLSIISLDSVSFICSEIQWKSTEVSCNLLKVGSPGWQQGKIIVQTKAINSFRENGSLTKYKDVTLDISVEFFPDFLPELTPPLESCSPLDKIRESEEYKKLGNN